MRVFRNARPPFKEMHVYNVLFNDAQQKKPSDAKQEGNSRRMEEGDDIEEGGAKANSLPLIIRLPPMRDFKT